MDNWSRRLFSHSSIKATSYWITSFKMSLYNLSPIKYLNLILNTHIFYMLDISIGSSLFPFVSTWLYPMNRDISRRSPFLNYYGGCNRGCYTRVLHIPPTNPIGTTYCYLSYWDWMTKSSRRKLLICEFIHSKKYKLIESLKFNI